jgi:hypothetical protein
MCLKYFEVGSYLQENTMHIRFKICLSRGGNIAVYSEKKTKVTNRPEFCGRDSALLNIKA